MLLVKLEIYLLSLLSCALYHFSQFYFALKTNRLCRPVLPNTIVAEQARVSVYNLCVGRFVQSWDRKKPESEKNRNRKKTGLFQPEPPRKFLIEPGKRELFNQNRWRPPEKFQVEPAKTGTGKNRRFSNGTAQKFSG